MKKLITNYTFSPLSKQVTLTDFIEIELNRLLLITNVTSGIIIYNFAKSSLGGTIVNNAVVLEYDTTTMNGSDDLQIYYDMDIDYGSGVITSGTQRVVLATDQTSLEVNDGGYTLSIDDNDGSITIDGSVDAVQSGIWSVELSESIPAGTNLIGSININQIEAGSNLIGKFGIDQTTPGTTNGVALTHISNTSVATGNGNVSSGVQRVAIAADNTPISVNATVTQDTGTNLHVVVDSGVVTNGPSGTQAAAPSNISTMSYSSNLIVKTSPGTLHMITGYNSSLDDQFIQIHDVAILPANNSVPVIIFKVPSESNFSFDLGAYGRYFSTGIVICNSSTGPIKTIGANDCWFDVQYK